jgi:hypothetical protein
MNLFLAEVTFDRGDFSERRFSLADHDGITQIEEPLHLRFVSHVLVHLTNGSAAEQEELVGPTFFERFSQIKGVNQLVVVDDTDAKAVSVVKLRIVRQPFVEEASEGPASFCPKIGIG